MVVGPSLSAAFSAAHALEDGAHVYALARQLGTPVLLPPDEVEKLHTFWREHYAK
jgi:L-fuculose-phosphate aldolase/L-ribulose-5-phosphate 4-epimerase